MSPRSKCSTAILSALLIARTLLGVTPANAFSSSPLLCNVDSATMQANHGGPTNSGNGGFVLSSSSPTYTPGQTLTITLNGVQPFKGILLYAFDGVGITQGTFQIPSGYQAMSSCGGASTLGHASPAFKPTPVSFTWTAPATGSGSLTFATLVCLDRPNWYVPAPLTITEAATDVAAPLPDAAQVTLSAAPNPFTESAAIHYSTASGGPVTLRIHDLSGRLVRTLAQGTDGPGSHRVTWNGCSDTGTDLGDGVFFVRLETGGRTEVRKLLRVGRPATP
ncbi:MAG: T9SS type A sorting domain-containing protein [Candidatus Eisenbacteria bacterium]|nr:T9SS type A sorting domain-containing protein [Candidatus Eisenbacteria bacterium]MCC7144731.1 T9SS type A sorting domain-containing protein [Candidatus Eisenbacteria bacterium]